MKNKERSPTVMISFFTSWVHLAGYVFVSFVFLIFSSISFPDIPECQSPCPWDFLGLLLVYARGVAPPDCIIERALMRNFFYGWNDLAFMVPR